MRKSPNKLVLTDSGKTYSVQKTFRVFHKLKDPTEAHPVHTGDKREEWEWATTNERHGNKRKAMRKLKQAEKKSQKLKDRKLAFDTENQE